MLAEILNYLQDGLLPFVEGRKCIETVKQYEMKEALKDFEEKLFKFLS